MLLLPPAWSADIAAREPDPALPGAPSGADWLAWLDRLVADLLDRWALEADGEAWTGSNAIVLPVARAGDVARTGDTGERLALKVTWPHAEARDEPLARRLWAGHGAVRLHDADPPRGALLLERLDAARPLRSVPILDACEEIGLLMRTLDRPATAQFETLTEVAARRERADATTGVPPRLTQQAAAFEGELLAGAPPASLVHWDLHDGNVLAPLDPARGAWLAIDPKPVAAEWAVAVAPVVWNRPDELARAANLRTHARLRADVVADAAGLDAERVRMWCFVRFVKNAAWAARFVPGSREFLSRNIALAKAFAD